MVAWSALIGLYGLLQLCALGFLRATISVRTLLAAVLVGGYTCTAVAYPLEYLAVGGLERGGVATPVTVASYSIDPVIEELVKAAPLVLLALRAGAALGITDMLLLGAATGLGFRFAEEWLRLTRGIDPGLPGLNGLLMWLPSGQQTDISVGWGGRRFPLAISGALVWTAMVGLGVGLSRRLPGPKVVRLAVPLLAVTWMSFDHALVNFSVARAVGNVVEATEFSGPARIFFALDGFGRAVPFFLLAGLVVALWLDRHTMCHKRRRLLERLRFGPVRWSLASKLPHAVLWIVFLIVFVAGTLPVVPQPWRVQRLFANPGTPLLFLMAAAMAAFGLRRFLRTPPAETGESDAGVCHDLSGLLSLGVLGAVGLGLWAGLSRGASDFILLGGAHLYDAASGAAPVTIVAGTAPGSTIGCGRYPERPDFARHRRRE